MECELSPFALLGPAVVKMVFGVFVRKNVDINKFAQSYLP